MPNLSGRFGARAQSQLQGSNDWRPRAGQQAYTTAGTYSWVAPPGVEFVSVVCVGGGAGAAASAGDSTSGGETYFIDATTVKAPPGSGWTGNGYNIGSYVGDGGSTVSVPNIGQYTTIGTNGTARGGGGAGGYFTDQVNSVYGSGGKCGEGSTGEYPFPGAGGGAGGAEGFGGGGTGLTGIGTDGAPAFNAGGGGGSGGNSATSYAGGTPGGGAGSPAGGTGGSGGGLAWKNGIEVVPGTSYTVEVGTGGTGTTSGSADGGAGGVRIMWGANRWYPNTNTGDI